MPFRIVLNWMILVNCLIVVFCFLVFIRFCLVCGVISLKFLRMDNDFYILPVEDCSFSSYGYLSDLNGNYIDGILIFDCSHED